MRARFSTSVAVNNKASLCIALLKMEFFVVIFDFHTKNDAIVVPKTWIWPRNGVGNFGERRYVFYHTDKTQHAPASNMMFSLFREVSENNAAGFVYKACVLAGFGKTFV
jgi:hypothetical protein